MLYRENKTIVIILLFTLIISCNKHKTYNTEEINNIRDNSVSMSLSIIGEKNYWKIYNQLDDSIKNWQDNQLKRYNEDTTKIKSQIDSVLCFNEKGNKMITTRLMSGNGSDEDVMDAIICYYGVKINNQWYFFSASTMYLPRKYYQEDIHTPLSFEKMKELAAKHIYRGYLMKNPLWKEQSGVEEYVINERFFADLTSVAWCVDCVTQEQWDAAYLEWVKDPVLPNL